jgi:hypothetical protein
MGSILIGGSRLLAGKDGTLGNNFI